MGQNTCVTQVRQITTREIKFKLHSPRHRVPLSISGMSITPVAAMPRPGSAVFAAEYRFDMTDVTKARIASAELSFVVICTTTPVCTKADLERFADGPLMALLHPYLSETVRTYTGHLGIPPLLLDIYRPTHKFDA